MTVDERLESGVFRLCSEQITIKDIWVTLRMDKPLVLISEEVTVPPDLRESATFIRSKIIEAEKMYVITDFDWKKSLLETIYEEKRNENIKTNQDISQGDN